jgi:hypothetical protein
MKFGNHLFCAASGLEMAARNAHFGQAEDVIPLSASAECCRLAPAFALHP